MGATRMGFFSREEFLGGMRSLRCDSVDSLCRACQQLDKEVRLSLSLSLHYHLSTLTLYLLSCDGPQIASPPRFRDFFRFAFHFCCTGALPPHGDSNFPLLLFYERAFAFMSQSLTRRRSMSTLWFRCLTSCAKVGPTSIASANSYVSRTTTHD